MSETVDVPRGVILPFEVVTDAAFPWGLRCSHEACERLIEPGQPFVAHVTKVYSDGDTLAHLACVYCPCTEPLVGAE